MKIAILYTGQLRTIHKTLPFFRENILLNDDVHVFATLEGEPFDIELDNFKSIKFLNPHDFVNIRDGLLINMNTHPLNKEYLKNSGSMIEYYQSYLSYLDLVKYEKLHGIEYDFVVRMRCDVIFTKPLNFAFLDLNVNTRLTDDFNLFMNSLLDPSRISGKFNDYTPHQNRDLRDPVEILEYIKNGNWIITLRKNIFYLTNRKNYSKISNLGIEYGKYFLKSNPGYWWDSESQFEAICIDNGLDIYNSTLDIEGKSLYDYQTDNYFTPEGKLLYGALFFICRI
jgi:hypothetical protein